jgi:hypothetical protein
MGESTLILVSDTEDALWLIKLVALLQLLSLSDKNTGDWIRHLSFR